MAASAATSSVRAARRRRSGPRRAPGPGGIRWDRVARLSLIFVLFAVLLSYIGPGTKYLRTWKLARETRAEVQYLRKDNQRMEATAKKLRDPAKIELEARRIGMARPGERVYVIRRLPKGP